MHGAALAWSLLMPPGTALLELWPQPGMWRLYEHTAEWAGLVYRCVHCIVCICLLTAAFEGQRLFDVVCQLGSETAH